jgi:biotin carboxyl carrier protein
MKDFDFIINGHDFNVKILSFSETDTDVEMAKIVVNGTEYEVGIKKKVEKTPTIKRVPVVASTVEGGVLTNQDSGTSLSLVKAPLPGVILKVICAKGQDVKMGQTLLVLEAMKMQNEIQAPRDGRIKEIKIREGQSVIEAEDLVVLA